MATFFLPKILLQVEYQSWEFLKDNFALLEWLEQFEKADIVNAFERVQRVSSDVLGIFWTRKTIVW